jgi:hypothetical protein
MLNTESVPPNISLIQILQNLEFTDAKFLLWSQKLWSESKPGLRLKSEAFYYDKTIIYSQQNSDHDPRFRCTDISINWFLCIVGRNIVTRI